MRDPRTPSSRLGAALVLLALLTAPGTGLTAPLQDASRTDVLPAGDVSRVLLTHEADPQLRAASELVELGAGALPELFSVLSSKRFRVRVGERGNSTRSLNHGLELMVVEALGSLPRQHLLDFLAGLAARGDSQPVEDQERITALRLLGGFALEEQIPLLVAIVGGPEGQPRIKHGVRTAFAEALGRTLARQDVSDRTLLAAFRQAHPSLLAPFISTLGEDASPRRLAQLSRLLGETPEVDVLVLAALGRVADRLPHPLGLRVADRVRPYLWHSKPQLLVEAALALSRLEDREAVPHLIQLLDHSNPNVVSKARVALEEITGRELGHDRDRWSHWHGRVLDWWASEAPQELERVRSGTAAEASRTVLELSKRRFYRHQLALDLAAALTREEPELVALTCATLGHLGSWNAVPPLVASLGHADVEVSSAAWRALQRITGLELPPEAELWEPVVADWRATR